MNEARLKILRETKEVHGQLIDAAIVSLQDGDEELAAFYMKLCCAVVVTTAEQL